MSGRETASKLASGNSSACASILRSSKPRMPSRSLLRRAQHTLAEVHADASRLSGQVRQVEAGPDAGQEDPPARRKRKGRDRLAAEAVGEGSHEGIVEGADAVVEKGFGGDG